MKNKVSTIAAIGAVVLFVLVAYYLYDALHERSVVERLAEIIHTEDERQLTDKLESYLGDDSLIVRERAVLAIGRIGHPRSGRLLMPMLEDSALGVAATAAFALGLTGDASLAAPLIAKATDLPATVAARAIEAAGRLADSTNSEVAQALPLLLNDPSPEVREAACYAYFHARVTDPALTDPLVTLAKAEADTTVRLAALYALAMLRVESAAVVFAKYQADADPHVRLLAVKGLEGTSYPEAIRFLAMSLNDVDKRVVAAAIAALQRKGGPDAAQYLAARLGRTNDEKLIVAVIEALTAMKNRAGLATAELHLNTGLTENVSAAAIVYVAAILGDRAIGRIDSLLYGAPSPAIRAACAEAYRAVNSDKVIPRLATLFADEDPLVRAGAFDVLMAVDSANLDFYLRKALADPDFMPNVLAINQIGERKLVSYLPNLVAFMARGVEADVDIRRSVIDAAGSLCDTLGPDSSLIKLLVDAMSDPEYVVCRQAAEIYRDKIGVDRTTVIRPARTHFTARQIESALAKYPTNPKATIITEKGAIELTLRFDTAPLTVMNFIELAESGLLRWSGVPPRCPELRGSGRRSAGNRLGRPGLVHPLRVLGPALRPRRSRGRHLGQRHRWLAILHYAFPTTSFGSSVYRVRLRYCRHGSGR
jgi:HEAT repeat protein